MYLARVKSKVKVIENFSEKITELPLKVILLDSWEKSFHLKGWNGKISRDYNMLSKELGCNLRGRSLSEGRLEDRLFGLEEPPLLAELRIGLTGLEV